jgi:hypothetical protein
MKLLPIVCSSTIAIAIATACGGAVDGDRSAGGGGSGGAGTGGAVSGGGFGGTSHFGGGTGGKLDAGKDAQADSGFPDGFVDPGCPDAEPPPPQFECDPLGPNTCGSGMGCYPFVQYPSGKCDFEQYGAICAPAGTGSQGEPCGGGFETCAPGLSCWLTGQGTECLQLCNTIGNNTCPPGLLCATTDVEGVGACF